MLFMTKKLNRKKGQTYSCHDELGASTTPSVTAQWTVTTAASIAVLPEVHLLTFPIHGTAIGHLSTKRMELERVQILKSS